MGIEPTRSAWKADVLPLNYARGGRSLVRASPTRARRRERSSAWESQRTRRNERAARVVGGTGFEPVKAMPSDLQSDPFGRSGILPRCRARTRVRLARRFRGLGV